jgi:hypothetical protein
VPHDQPRLTYEGRGWYEVTNAPSFVGKDITVIVESGFRTDLATSPRIFWALVPPFGAYEAAAVLHDWLLKLLQQGDSPVPSVDIDGWFRRIMRESDVGLVTRWSMWVAVRWAALFSSYRRPGWLSWPETPLVLLISAAWLVVAFTAAVGTHLAVDLVWSWIS